MSGRVSRFIVCTVSLISLTGVAAAQSSPTGITISPPSQRIAIQPDEATHPLTFKLTNNENKPQTVDISSQDFDTLQDTGGLFFVGANPTALQHKYGLVQWLEIPVKQVVLSPHQTVDLMANIINLPSLTGGGHYGALMISLPGQAASGTNNVSVKPVASALLFVDKVGGDRFDLHLEKVSHNGSLFQLPSHVELKFNNPGNVHVIPRGVIRVQQTGSDKLLKQGIINTDSLIILPEKSRLMSVNLRSLGGMGLGLISSYQLSVDYHYEGLDKITTRTITFHTLHPEFFLAILAAGLGIGWLGFGKHKLFHKLWKTFR